MSSAPVLKPENKVHIIWEGKKYLFFGGYDYYRLSCDPGILKAARDALSGYGLNCGGSRVTTGNHPLHLQLEKVLSEFLGTEDTALLPAGYMANLALFEVLGTRDVVCFYHPLCHPSLKTAITMSGLPALEIPAAPEAFDGIIREKGKRPLIVTDGTYDELPPLPAYYGLAEKYDGVLLLDEAHTLGILGKHGRGAFEHYGLDTGRLLLTGSLSKACGTSGGFVSGPGRCIRAVRETCAYATTSAPSLPLVAAGIASIRFFRDHPRRIRDLQERCVDVKQRLVAMGFDVPVIPTPVAGIYLPGTEQAGALKEALKYAGIYPPLIRYPGKPDYFRFAFSSAHSDEDIDRLLDVLRVFRSQMS